MVLGGAHGEGTSGLLEVESSRREAERGMDVSGSMNT